MNCQRIGYFAWNSSCHVSFTLQPYGFDNLLLNCLIDRFYLEGERGTINLLYVKFLSIAHDVVSSLPIAEVEEMEKTFRDNWISDADVLSLCDCLESYSKRKNLWEQLKSSNLHMILCS